MKNFNKVIVISLLSLVLALPASACMKCKYLSFGSQGGLWVCLFTEEGSQQCWAYDETCSTWGRCTVLWA